MNSLGRPDSFMMRWFGKIGEFFCLSILWMVCCMPILTIIPACIALYDSVAHCLHGTDDHPYRRFFRTLRSELLRGIGLTLLWGVIAFLLISGYRITTMAGEGTFAAVYSMLYAGTMLVPLAMLTWLIPIQSRFRYGFFQLHQVALTYTVIHLPTTAAILGILLATVVLLITVPALALLLPAICVTIQAFLIEKVFTQYMPEEDADDHHFGN